MSDRLQQLKKLISTASVELPDIRNLFEEDSEPDVSNDQLKGLFEERGREEPALEPQAQPLPADQNRASSAQVSSGEDMSSGHSGERVRALQQKLQDKGYRISMKNSKPDGAFGRGTKNAVIYFQVLNEIHPANGVVNQATLSKLNSLNSIGPNVTVEPVPEREGLSYTEKDVEAAARGLVVETAFRANYNEMAGIVWIMINRAKRWNMSIEAVIHPDTGGGKNWYGGLSPNNRKRWAAASNRQDFEYIKDFVRKILNGASFENPIGNRAHFLHPGGMPKCSGEPGSPCGSRGHRVCVDTGTWGKRCLPKWNIEGNSNMAGRVNVETIGAARFS